MAKRSLPLEPSLDRHIEVTPGVVGGKPRISGRRISVQDVAVWHERMGRTVDEIAAEYDLSLAQVHAALAYYFDHRAQIDEAMRQAALFVDEQRRAMPSKVLRKIQDRAAHGRAS